MTEGCTCGWGGVHDPDNPRCALNQGQNRGSEDKPHVGRLADTFAERERAHHKFIDTYDEGQRDAWDRAEADLRAAIEADRADGWLSPSEAAALEAECLREAERRDELRAEVERLRKDNARLERIARLEEVRAEAGNFWTERSLRQAAEAEVERLREAVTGGLQVEIQERLNEPSTCKVWRGGVLVFDGVSRDALLTEKKDD